MSELVSVFDNRPSLVFYIFHCIQEQTRTGVLDLAAIVAHENVISTTEASF